MEVFINKLIQLWAEPGDGWVERKPLRSHRGNLPECIVPEEVLLFSVCESLAFVSLSTLASKPTAYTWSSDWPCGSLTFDLCCVSPAFYQYSSESAFLKLVLTLSFELAFSWSSSAHRVRHWVIDRSDNSLHCSLWAALQGVGLNHWQRFWLSHGFLFTRLMHEDDHLQFNLIFGLKVRLFMSSDFCSWCVGRRGI